MLDFYSQQIANLASEGNLRHIPADTSSRPGVTDLSTNDYLGLGSDRKLREEFYDSCDVADIPMSSTASRLLSSSQKYYSALEDRLAELYGKDILLFNSGYHANTGLIAAIASAPDTFVIADRLVHASIIDGIVLSKCRFTRFPHNDFDRLHQLLEKNAGVYRHILVIVESVYSMDGDRADIGRLIELKRRYDNVMLYVDEAHAFGVEGPMGLGMVAAHDSAGEVDVTVGTFGKACASMGAFCAVSPTLKKFILNRARSFIFSTALPPVTAAWTLYVINKIVDMDQQRAHLHSLGHRLANGINALQPSGKVLPSHIAPIIVGSPVKAVELSTRLLEQHFKVLPIRVPTVPPGTDRLRVSLSASLTSDDVDRFIHTLSSVLS
ncbi:MAG: 8-amino-7-oxononanoate synthase [Bacteroides sp.]|nr:8-amino-7-oxononanoate synthase [Bacteroides sp.]